MRVQAAMEFMIYAGVLTLLLAYFLLVGWSFFQQEGSLSTYYLSKVVLWRVSSVLEFMQRVPDSPTAYTFEIPKAIGGLEYVIYMKKYGNSYLLFLEIPSTGEVFTAKIFGRRFIHGDRCTSSREGVVLNSSASTLYTVTLDRGSLTITSEGCR